MLTSPFFQLENDLKAAHQKLSLTEEELDKAESSVTELTTRAETAEKEAEEAQRYLYVLFIPYLDMLFIIFGHVDHLHTCKFNLFRSELAY